MSLALYQQTRVLREYWRFICEDICELSHLRGHLPPTVPFLVATAIEKQVRQMATDHWHAEGTLCHRLH